MEQIALSDISVSSLHDREPLLSVCQLTGRCWCQQLTEWMLQAGRQGGWCLTLLQVLLVVPRFFLFGHEFLHSPWAKHGGSPPSAPGKQQGTTPSVWTIDLLQQDPPEEDKTASRSYAQCCGSTCSLLPSSRLCFLGHSHFSPLIPLPPNTGPS